MFKTLKILVGQRNLLFQMTVRNVQLRYRGSNLGLLWAICSPLSMLAIYIFVFGFIFGGSFGVLENESAIQYGLAIFIGLAVFQFVGEVLTTSPVVITSNTNFVKKIKFPLEILVFANVLVAGFGFILSYALAITGTLIWGPEITPTILLIPLILVPLVLTVLGCALILASIGVFFRDIGHIMNLCTTGLMFASAVFYGANMIPAAAWKVLRFNPVLLIIENARNVILWQHPMNWNHLGYCYFVALITYAIGLIFFDKTKSAFADVL